MATRSQLSLLIIMCSLGGIFMYSIPDLFYWLYFAGVTPDSMGVITSLLTLTLLALAVWVNGYMAQLRHKERLRLAAQLQMELDKQDIPKTVKVGNILKPSTSGFKFQKSND